MCRHLSLIHATSAGYWRGRRSAVKHVCLAASQILSTQYHWGTTTSRMILGRPQLKRSVMPIRSPRSYPKMSLTHATLVATIVFAGLRMIVLYRDVLRQERCGEQSSANNLGPICDQPPMFA
jgi:hypothetical protein